ncbi:MAG TPA: hypothetical protein RMH85_07605 [Polyangiaceae bacterium LLY-WYZ-15_(1-7)]|nr:hypothetical protein [Polyangiaceae bacterium LLY-WYZ-15_(1-7)]HJL05728.1 hypothetical protein [Polyangiaceae bacterium LLY-WYZ-15_(1-7)]HJL08346.1 hypothetical protein [Polyangiaceae bacterium LLY-WYZ-15_(1-7)]HJL31217.1 hypothetical protein [Polyangiaceae bacterium LLY-WYZ-15_(1-7)]HJL34147.1 hypothetical protein [Polyangiaceae bacterium LLY-WYZ-15_(1-7)]
MRRDRERRIYKLFVTRNSEYLMRGDVCVGVRDRRSGTWSIDHEAVTQVVATMVHRQGERVRMHSFTPRVGSALYFARGPVLTSSVRAVRRPDRATYDDWRRAIDSLPVAAE